MPSNIFSALALALSSKILSKFSLLWQLSLDSSRWTLSSWWTVPSVMAKKLKVSTTLMTLLRFFFFPMRPYSWQTFRMALQVEMLTPRDCATARIDYPPQIIREMMAERASSGIFLQPCRLFFQASLIIIIFETNRTGFNSQSPLSHTRIQETMSP